MRVMRVSNDIQRKNNDVSFKMQPWSKGAKESMDLFEAGLSSLNKERFNALLARKDNIFIKKIQNNYLYALILDQKSIEVGKPFHIISSFQGIFKNSEGVIAALEKQFKHETIPILVSDVC